MMLSHTVIWSKSRTSWKVRVIPWSGVSCAFRTRMPTVSMTTMPSSIGQHPAQQVDQGRLARSVWTDDAGDPLPEDGYRKLVHGVHRAKALRDRLRLQGEHAGIDFGFHSRNFPTRPCGRNNMSNTNRMPSTTCRAWPTCSVGKNGRKRMPSSSITKAMAPEQRSPDRGQPAQDDDGDQENRFQQDEGVGIDEAGPAPEQGARQARPSWPR